MNIANRITLIRVILVPFYIFFYLKDMYLISIILFVIASLSDALDGYLARKNNIITNFGKIMDPLADKMIVYSAFCLMIPELIPSWTFIIILIREFLVSGIRIVAASNGNVIAAKLSGKIKTFLQMVSVPLLIFTKMCPKIMFFYYLAYIVFYASLIFVIYSGIEYTLKNKEVFK